LVNGVNYWCNNCKKQVNHSHQCFINKEEDENEDATSILKKKDKFNGLIFFDYEARTCPETHKHIPDLIVSKTVCHKCLSISDKSKWCDADLSFNVFEDNDKFGDWLFSKEDYIAIAHNFKGYDSSFIMSYIYDNLRPSEALPSILTVGTKILSIKFRKVSLLSWFFMINIFNFVFHLFQIKIIDSCSFLKMPLHNFPATFNFLEKKKGFFPFLLNNGEKNNFDRHPPIEYYQPELMSLGRKKNF
jgi:hypothetical protein